MRKVMIAQVINKMNYGGIEVFLLNYYKEINKEKFQFDFIVSNKSLIPQKKDIEDLGGKVFEVVPFYNFFKYKKQLKRIFKENNYDIVHSHLNIFNFIALSVAKKSNIMVRIAHIHTFTNKKEIFKNIIKKSLKVFSKKNATAFFSCSEENGKWWFKNDYKVINNAIDIDKFRFDENKRKIIRKRLGYKDEIVIGHVGRFVKVKNHKFIIKTFKKLYLKNNNYRLLLIGEGRLKTKTIHQIKKNGLNKVIKIISNTDEVNDFLLSMDIFVLPSLYEGSGIVAIEAQASGLNCLLSTNIFNETRLLNTTKFIDLKDNWVKVLLNEKLKKRYKSYKEVEEKFDIKKETIKLENIYLSLLGMGDEYND